MVVQVARRRFTVDEYHAMVRAGILAEDDRVELIDGELLQMSPIGRRHAGCVNRLTRLFVNRAGGLAVVSVQNPVRLSEQSEPQPDLALLRPRDDFYASGHPGPEDILLLVEVAETSADYDRQVKIPVYAKAGVREVWLVDLTGGVVEVYRDPGQEGYRQVQTVSGVQQLVPLALPQIRFSADEIVG